MIRAYHSPERMEEALALLAKGGVPLAGATALYTARSSRDLELVDVTRLGLNTLRVEGDQVVVGAGVTLAQIAQAAEIPGMPGALLRKCARAVASEPLRNMITVGGNLAALNYWADIPPVLIALQAKIEIQHQGQPPTVLPVAACLESKKHPWEGGMITALQIPLPKATQVFGYERFVRTVTDYSLATACVTMTCDGDRFRDVHIVLAAVQSRPFRAKEAESLLEGKPFEEASIEAAVATLAEIPIAPNYRASATYRRHLIGVLCGRALRTAYHWARES